MSATARHRARQWAAAAAVVSVSACAAPGAPAAPAAADHGGTPAAAAPAVACSGPGSVTVRAAEQLTAALAGAAPGAVIVLADGTYDGSFTAHTSATAARPITLCGSPAAVLDGGGADSGYTLHLDGASYWKLSGFTVRGGQKGVVVDGGQHDLITGLTIENVGDEALHLRAASSDNLVSANVIRTTGLHQAKFGEGVYVGSARSNWCKQSACGPDRSDRNTIENNTISATSAESVDIKEGTTGGVLRGNAFSGTGMKAADSWVDVKGNGWTISTNRGVDAPVDGYQVHRILDGWGMDNTFTGNVSDVGGDGYAVNVTNDGDGNHVACNNTESHAGKGLTNVDCSP